MGFDEIPMSFLSIDSIELIRGTVLSSFTHVMMIDIVANATFIFRSIERQYLMSFMKSLHR